MNVGFHTISLLLHDETTAANELARIGFRTIAVRPRLSGLDPGADRFVARILQFMDTSRRLNLQVIFDIDAHYLHDPQIKEGPSLASPDDAEADDAQAWIEKWIEIVAEYGVQPSNDAPGDRQSPRSDLVTFGVGIDDASQHGELQLADEYQLERLATRLDRLIARAADAHVRLALRPASGHAIAKVAEFERLQQWLGGTSPLLLAADVGQMLSAGEFPVGARLTRNAELLACVYLSQPNTQSTSGVSLSPGEVDFARVLRVLKKSQIEVPAIVQVRGRSEQGLEIAQQAWRSLH
ncbi:MAG: TIM barrel protein [Pirellulaceae bacterium]|nr:TIM barrel protein [Pirellulaceae bacterium]